MTLQQKTKLPVVAALLLLQLEAHHSVFSFSVHESPHQSRLEVYLPNQIQNDLHLSQQVGSSGLGAINNPRTIKSQQTEWIDLSYTYDNDTNFYPLQRFAFLHMKDIGPILNVTGDGRRRFSYATYSFCMSEHGGTHIDAPFHFSQFGWKMDEIPLDRLMDVPTVVIDMEEQVFTQEDPTTFVMEVDHLLEHEAKFGKIPRGALVLIRFGWGKFWNDKIRYVGWNNSTVPFGGNPTFAFPGCSPEVAKWLLHQRGIIGLGVDTMSPDHAANVNSGNSYVHLTLLEANVYILEMVANLDFLLQRTRPHDDPNKNCNDLRAFVSPMKTKGTGGPVRLVAYCRN